MQMLSIMLTSNANVVDFDNSTGSNKLQIAMTKVTAVPGFLPM